MAWQFADGDLTGQTYPIEVRSKQDEIILCQRYFLSYGGYGNYDVVGVGFAGTTSLANILLFFPNNMRSGPSLSISAVADWVIQFSSSSSVVTVLTGNQITPQTAALYCTVTGTPLTIGAATTLLANNTLNARLNFDVEL